jgi:hypothetical protein
LFDPLTILHVSDLHRDPTNEVSNKALLLSLEQDRDRYRAEVPRIPDPNLIIASGDIIHGVRHDAVNAEAELQRQYDQAEEFLVELADRFVGGDRERVVIIPGNHDVSFAHANRAMKQVNVNLASEKGLTAATTMAKRLWAVTNPVRWAWGEFCFYEVTDRALYNRRLEAFCKFYATFYKGTRTYSVEPEKQFDIFDYPQHNVTIVGMSSCHDNDPRNKKGEIQAECFSEACLRIRHPQYRGRLLLATWHHNTQGGPTQNDYMDPEILQSMIDCGFSIGFHGHQHRPQFIEEKYQFGTEKRIVVISAGTLCAGPSEIPLGETRAYNVVEVDPLNLTARLHQRRMQNQTSGIIIWGCGRFSLSNASYVSFNVQPPPERDNMKVDHHALGEAEVFMRRKEFDDAVTLLKPMAAASALAKRMLWDCYVEQDDVNSIVAEFYPPSSASEFVYMAEVLWEHDHDKLRALLELDVVKSSSDGAVVEVRDKYNARLVR